MNSEAREKVQYKRRKIHGEEVVIVDGTPAVTIRQIMSKREVVRFTGLSPPTIWRRMKAGDFPLSIQLTPNKVGWFLDEIEVWMESRPRGVAELPVNLKNESVPSSAR